MNYRGLSNPAPAEYEHLTEAMAVVTPLCIDDERFIRDNISPPPLAVICGKCPLLTECHAYASRAKPAAGIWAGRRWNTSHERKTA